MSADKIDVLAVLDSASALYLMKEAGSSSVADTEYWRGLHQRNVTARIAIASLIGAGQSLSFSAQITGGTAGRDAGLVAAIEHFNAILAKVLP